LINRKEWNGIEDCLCQPIIENISKNETLESLILDLSLYIFRKFLSLSIILFSNSLTINGVLKICELIGQSKTLQKISLNFSQ